MGEEGMPLGKRERRRGREEVDNDCCTTRKGGEEGPNREGE